MAIEIDLNNIPTDPEELQRAFEQLESGKPIEAKPADVPPADTKQDDTGSGKVEDDKAAQTQQQQQTDDTSEQDAAGVATKDGKHVIPYSVLQSARDRASRAEQLAMQAQERVQALEAQLSQGSQGAKQGEGARTEPQAVNDLSPEDLEALKEDFPTVYKAVQASMALAKTLEARLNPVAESVREVVTERAQTDADSVQEAIDSVPKLAHIQATNREAFDLAKQFDATLRAQAAWADKPLSERFAKVADMVEATLGPIKLPNSQQASQDPAALVAAAKAKAQQAAKNAVPTSLSEAPAGQHAAQDEQEAASQMTHQQLAEKFAGMTQEQMDQYLNSL